MNVNLKSLVGRLNDTCRAALEAAAGLCLSRTNYGLSRTNYDVEVEHQLLRLLDAADTDVGRVLRHYEIDEARLLASVKSGAAKVRSGHLLLVLLTSDELARLAREVSREFSPSRPSSYTRA